MKTEVVKPKGVFLKPDAPRRSAVPSGCTYGRRKEHRDLLWQDIVQRIEVISQHDQQATSVNLTAPLTSTN